MLEDWLVLQFKAGWRKADTNRMKNALGFARLRAALRPRDLLDYWHLSRKIHALERSAGESHYGCKIVYRVRKELGGQFSASLLRNIRPFRYWTKKEAMRIRRMALRTAIRLAQFDTNAQIKSAPPKVRRKMLAERRRLMRSFPARGRTATPADALAVWLQKLEAARKAFGIGRRRACSWSSKSAK